MTQKMYSMYLHDCQYLKKKEEMGENYTFFSDRSQTHTYIGNDRELADATENVVPNPWRQQVCNKQ